jgi:hypothetical protein
MRSTAPGFALRPRENASKSREFSIGGTRYAHRFNLFMRRSKNVGY